MRNESELQGNRANSALRGGALSFWGAWNWWIFPALVAVVLAILFVDPFIGDWDALDYTLASVEGRPSSMALGRSLFIFINHSVWRIAHSLFGLPVENAYVLFKYMVVFQAPFAVIACWAFARELSASVHTATIAGLLIATSPFFVIYSGQVMTEIPSLFLLGTALVIYLRGVRSQRLRLMLLGAAVLGAGVNMREPVALYAPWLIAAPFACGWTWSRRHVEHVLFSVVVFLVVSLGPFLIWFWSDYEGYRSAWYGWRESMRVEASRHPLTSRGVLAFLVYFFLASPLVCVAFPVAAFNEWRANRVSPLLAAACVGLCATLLLLLNYSTSINWRYFLTGLPALAPIVAAYFMQAQIAKLGSTRRAFTSVIISVVAVALILGLYLKPSRDRFTAQHAAMRDYRSRLALVPQEAVVIPGSQSIAVTYWREIGAGRWSVIGAGSGWPGPELTSVIQNHLTENRRVVIDADPRFWSPCGWQEAETRELAGLEKRFRFRRISDTIFEVRPLTDLGAHDIPNLHELLPENRSDEVERCKGQGKLS